MKNIFYLYKIKYQVVDFVKKNSQVKCDKTHPENHSIKYVKRYPPTYNSVVLNEDGNIISIIKSLKDTCELLSDPVLDILKVKIKECVKKYKKDKDIDLDFEDAVNDLRRELKKDNIKKILNNFLKNDLINNIEMKLQIT